MSSGGIYDITIRNVGFINRYPKVGNQEFPEIMNRTPGEMWKTTKQGGGYGDSRISLRWIRPKKHIFSN